MQFLRLTLKLKCSLNLDIRSTLIRGPGGGGGPRSIFTFLLFLIEENATYQELFTELKNIALSLKYCWSKVSAVV